MQRGAEATYRLIRYADDFVVLVRGSRDQDAGPVSTAISRRGVILASLGLRLARRKTKITTIDEGLRLSGVPHPAAPTKRKRGN